LTDASPISTPLSLSAKAADISAADFANADFLAFFRRVNSGAWALEKLIWDGATTSYTAVISDAKVNLDITPPTYNQTGANAEFLFADVQDLKGIQPVFSTLDTGQLTGQAVASESLPGPVKLDWEIGDVFSLGYSTLILASLINT